MQCLLCFFFYGCPVRTLGLELQWRFFCFCFFVFRWGHRWGRRALYDCNERWIMSADRLRSVLISTRSGGRQDCLNSLTEQMNLEFISTADSHSNSFQIASLIFFSLCYNAAILEFIFSSYLFLLSPLSENSSILVHYLHHSKTLHSHSHMWLLLLKGAQSNLIYW